MSWLPVCPDCLVRDVARFGSIDFGDWRCVKCGNPLHLFIDIND